MERPDQSAAIKGRRYLSVAQDLLTAIGRGDYSAGSRLPSERDMVTQTGVSRATVREALLALELVGSVEVRHGEGVYVRGPHARLGRAFNSALDVPPRELIETRRTLEPAVAAMAAARMDADCLRRARRGVDEAAELVYEPSRLPRFIELGLRFHADVSLGCSNSLLASLIAQLVDVESHPLWALVNQQAMSSDAARESQIHEHRTILDAIAGGETDTAQWAMSTHLNALEAAVFEPEFARTA